MYFSCPSLGNVACVVLVKQRFPEGRGFVSQASLDQSIASMATARKSPIPAHDQTARQLLPVDLIVRFCLFMMDAEATPLWQTFSPEHENSEKSVHTA